MPAQEELEEAEGQHAESFERCHLAQFPRRLANLIAILIPAVVVLVSSILGNPHSIVVAPAVSNAEIEEVAVNIIVFRFSMPRSLKRDAHADMEEADHFFEALRCMPALQPLMPVAKRSNLSREKIVV